MPEGKKSEAVAYQYGAKTDAVVYGCDETADFESEDWIRLALAALDQAGVTPARLSVAYQHARGSTEGAIEELR